MKTFLIIVAVLAALFIIPLPIVLIGFLIWAVIAAPKAAVKKSKKDIELIKSIAKKVSK